MNKIKIDIDNQRFILKGDIECILKSRRALRYLKDYLNPDLSVDHYIYIPYESTNKENILSKIRDMLKKFDIEEQRSINIESLLNDYFTEERNFEKFSQKALAIRNNECDLNDFSDFIRGLNKYLPNRTLYGLQLLSAYHLAFAHNACNFSVPGAGKTSIVYGAYSYLKNLPKNSPKFIEKILIIGPLSSFGPWEDEYFECFGKKPTSKRLSGGISKQEKTRYLYSDFTSELTLISYQTVPTILDDLGYFLRNHYVMVVLDEAHKIKNTDGGIIAKSVLEIAKYCRARIVLTGTPAPNGYEDLYNLYKFLWPTKNIIKFHLNQLREITNDRTGERVERLIDNISPFFIRIKKSDLGIPEPINNPPIKINMGTYQRYLYDFIEKKYMTYFINNESDGFKSSLTKARLIRLMQVATNPALLKKPLDEYFSTQGLSSSTYLDDTDIINRIINYEKQEIPEKFKITAELVERILEKNGKVIIWLTFIQNIKELSAYLNTRGIETRLLYGDIPVNLDDNNDDYLNIETREDIIHEFHNPDSQFKVIIANPFAVSESISLHKACHNAIYVERTFNVAQFIQSKDRIHRYGLKKEDKINYYYLVANDSIDETIDERLREKESKMIEIMESRQIPLFDNLTDDYGDEDIKVMIKNYVKRNL